MKKPSKSTVNFIRTYFPFIKIRKNEIMFYATEKQSYEIPGDIYPLKNKKTARIFTYADTKVLEQGTIIEKSFNTVSFQTGFCYTNTELLKDALLKVGITDVETYTGWVFLNGMPVHHCWLVYKGEYLLDAGVTRIDERFKNEILEQNISNMDEARLLYKQIHDEMAHLPNSELRTFGQVAPFALYIGSQTTPNQGRTLYNEVIQKYPEHPSYQSDGMNATGRSKLQEMLLK